MQLTALTNKFILSHANSNQAPLLILLLSILALFLHRSQSAIHDEFGVTKGKRRPAEPARESAADPSARKSKKAASSNAAPAIPAPSHRPAESDVERRARQATFPVFFFGEKEREGEMKERERKSERGRERERE